MRQAKGEPLAEALLDRLPRPVQGFCDLRPGGALRTSLFDRSPLNLLLAATAVQRARESGETEDFDLVGADGARATEAQGLVCRL